MFDTALFYGFQLIRRLSVELNFFFLFEYFAKKRTVFIAISFDVIVPKSLRNLSIFPRAKHGKVFY